MGLGFFFVCDGVEFGDCGVLVVDDVWLIF